MNRQIVAVLFLILGFASCAEKQQILTKKDIQAKVDSAVNARMEEVNRQASEDLDYRTSIEVKAKADSIVAAKHMPKDSLQPKVSLQQEVAKNRGKIDSAMRARNIHHILGR